MHVPFFVHMVAGRPGDEATAWDGGKFIIHLVQYTTVTNVKFIITGWKDSTLCGKREKKQVCC